MSAVGFLALAGLSSLAALTPVLFVAGWPLNHELAGWAERLAVHVSALQAGDLFPLWWSDGALGLGTPMPLLYHKLFNMVAALVYLVTGRFQTAAVVALLCFNLVGVYGLRAACSVAIDERASRWLALTFPHLSYALTDWLVRGAFAEFAAMAVGTWLLWWCLRLAGTGTVSRGLPLIATALVLAHSVIAFVGAAILALAVLVRVVMNRDALTVLRRLARPAVVTVLVTAPLGLLMVVVLARTNTAALVHEYHPTKQFVAWTRYFHDPGYRWGRRWQGFSVRLDAPLLLTVAAGLAAGGLRRFWRRKTTDRDPVVTDAQRRAWALLGAVVLVFGFLQLPLAAWLYLHVPGLALIQFPWRLLAYLGPVLVILAGLSLELGCKAWSRSVAPWAAVLAAAVIVTSPAFRPIRYDWIPARLLEAVIAPRPQQWPEYWPRGKDPELQSEDLLAALGQRGVEDVGTGHCRGRAAGEAYLMREFAIGCTADSVVALPVAHYGLEWVTVMTTGQHTRRRLPAARTADDPRLRVVLPPGQHRLRVELPTLGRLLRLGS